MEAPASVRLGIHQLTTHPQASPAREVTNGRREKMSNGNESAYPVIPPTDSSGVGSAGGYPYPSAGLTKREAFAMAAMQGYCANQEYANACGRALEAFGIEVGSQANADGVRKLIAKAAIGCADAILAELDKQP